MTTPLLSLSTLDPERPTIKIDGQKYECAVVDDFGVVQRTRLERLIRKAQQLREFSDDDTDEQAEEKAQEAETFCRKAVAIFMPALPADLLAKLHLTHLMAIITAYTDFIKAAGMASQTKPLPKFIGVKSSRDSKDSMAATPVIG